MEKITFIIYWKLTKLELSNYYSSLFLAFESTLPAKRIIPTFNYETEVYSPFGNLESKFRSFSRSRKSDYAVDYCAIKIS